MTEFEELVFKMRELQKQANSKRCKSLKQDAAYLEKKVDKHLEARKPLQNQVSKNQLKINL
jgi:hypothetical protein